MTRHNADINNGLAQDLSSTKSDAPIEIRALTVDLAQEVVAVHLRAFPKFFLTFLGPKFLYLYYKSIIDFSQFGLVAIRRNQVIGFVGGVDAECGFYRKLAIHRGIYFALPLIPIVIKKPSAIIRIMNGVMKRSASASDTHSTVYLTSIAVLPDTSGLGVGQQLVHAFEALVKQKAFQHIVLETDAEDNDRTVRFYKELGFTIRKTYATLEGRHMHEFRKSLGV